MIKHIALAMLLSVGLGGCATATNPTSTTPDYTDIVKQVQAAALTACKFVPTAGSIISMISAGNPGIVGGVAIAEAICSALAGAPAAAARHGEVHGSVHGWQVSAVMRGAKVVPMVNGVAVQGRFAN